VKYEIDLNHPKNKIVHGYNSMMDAMDDQRIFTVTQTTRGFIVEEHCDDYFSVLLSGEQLEALGRELIEMAKRKAP
jgi:hypothetical protein